MHSQYAQVTPIDRLPELEDLEGAGAGGQHNTQQAPAPDHTHSMQQAGRMIRQQSRTPPPEAGMSGAGQGSRAQAQVQMAREGGGDHPHLQQGASYEEGESPLRDEGGLTKYSMPDGTPSCLDVAEHIANCPICSKFYNNDKTIYIIAIAILAIICILLLKKVLNV